MGIYNLFSTFSYIMLTLCYYDIDCQQVNGTVRESFIPFPMLAHKSSFPTSSAKCVCLCSSLCSLGQGVVQCAASCKNTDCKTNG